MPGAQVKCVSFFCGREKSARQKIDLGSHWTACHAKQGPPKQIWLYEVPTASECNLTSCQGIMVFSW